jgi:hypothetical protein
MSIQYSITQQCQAHRVIIGELTLISTQLKTPTFKRNLALVSMLGFNPMAINLDSAKYIAIKKWEVEKLVIMKKNGIGALFQYRANF